VEAPVIAIYRFYDLLATLTMHVKSEVLDTAITDVIFIVALLLTGLAWKKWNKSRGANGNGVLIANVLASASCVGLLIAFGLVPIFLLIPIFRESQLSVYVMLAGTLASAISGVVGLVAAPFASIRTKWLSFLACAVNTLFLVTWFLSLH
jgi:hypothetical protein